MQTLTKLLYIPALTMLLLASPATAAEATGSDLAKEKRWADQIIEALLDGEAITLNDGQHDFLGILTETEQDKPAGAVILLHGSGVHPDWPQVIHPLRVALPEKGWTTLSLQLPILANEAETRDYLPIIPHAKPRIQAGIAYLKTKGFNKIHIVAHSLGTVMAAHTLAASAMDINSLVAVGMPEMTTQYLSKINLPLLDLYGEHDLESIVNSAALRQQQAAHNKQFSQIKTPGADHFYNNRDDELNKTVVEWLNKH